MAWMQAGSIGSHTKTLNRQQSMHAKDFEQTVMQMLRHLEVQLGSHHKVMCDRLDNFTAHGHRASGSKQSTQEPTPPMSRDEQPSVDHADMDQSATSAPLCLSNSVIDVVPTLADPDSVAPIFVSPSFSPSPLGPSPSFAPFELVGISSEAGARRFSNQSAAAASSTASTCSASSADFNGGGSRSGSVVRSRVAASIASGTASQALAAVGEGPQYDSMRCTQGSSTASEQGQMPSGQNSVDGTATWPIDDGGRRESGVVLPFRQESRSRRRGEEDMLMGGNLTNELACKAIALFTRRPQRNKWAVKTWNFLEDRDSSTGARILDDVVPFFLFVTVVFTLLQTVEPRSPLLSNFLCTVVDLIIDSIFTVEVITRYFVCPIRGLVFFTTPFNMIDVVAAMPLLVRIVKIMNITSISDEDYDLVLLCLVPTLRLLKMMRRFQKIQLLVGAFKLAFEALPVLMFTLTLITLSFASGIYLVEPKSNIEALPKALWFTIVTMTTVGYGDVTPVSTEGHCIVAVLTVSSVLYMAMPLGIVGQAFTQVWNDRDRILLVKRARVALTAWGYTASDIPVLCQIFDTAGAGELNLTDFCRMIRMMRIGLQNDRIIELFDAFDTDGSGSLDDRELVRQLFPHSYHELYDKERSAVARGIEADTKAEANPEVTSRRAMSVVPQDLASTQNGSDTNTSVKNTREAEETLRREQDKSTMLPRFSGRFDNSAETALVRRISQDLMQVAVHRKLSAGLSGSSDADELKGYLKELGSEGMGSDIDSLIQEVDAEAEVWNSLEKSKEEEPKKRNSLRWSLKLGLQAKNGSAETSDDMAVRRISVRSSQPSSDTGSESTNSKLMNDIVEEFDAEARKEERKPSHQSG